MKAILIDARAKEVRAVDVDKSKGIKPIYDHVKCETFTCVILEGEETLYVDDEGLINGTDVGFVLSCYQEPLMGNGLILGTDEMGESVDTKLTVEEVRSWVIFKTRVEMARDLGVLA